MHEFNLRIWPREQIGVQRFIRYGNGLNIQLRYKNYVSLPPNPLCEDFYQTLVYLYFLCAWGNL